ncbi:MAG: MFS transporter, partial [Proteobacteria bacterium]|nr:MFS transporter [Pseudomonadota bacterium]
DPHSNSLLSAFAFCSTFVLRPFGALFFGYIGDQIGRKSTVILTTMMMSISCVIMANLPTYEQIGIAAAWIMTICRVVQGLSSMGEIMGAQIYVAEITKPPVQYVAVSFISLASSIGGSFALCIAFLVTTVELNWRIAFWIGAGIAVVGSLARTRLRETPEFLIMKKRKNNNVDDPDNKKMINMKSVWAYFSIYCGWPLSFYLAFMYFNTTLKENFLYTSENIIFHNFLLSLILIVSAFSWSVLCFKIHPLKILRLKCITFLGIIALLPFFLMNSTSYVEIFMIQVLLLVFNLGDNPGAAIFIKTFPVLKRFTVTSLLYAITRALMYIITSFGLVYLTDWIGVYGIWIIALPVIIVYFLGIRYFNNLEKNINGLSLRYNVPPNFERKYTIE